VLVGVQSAAFAVSSPTKGAIVPRLVPTGLVPAANTLTFTFSTASMVVGPLLAGLALARGSYALAYAMDAALFSVGLYAALRLPKLPPLGEITPPGLKSVVDGLRFIATEPVLWLSFAIDIVAMVLAMPRALFPEVAETQYGGEEAVGWLYAAIAAGSMLAGLASGWIGRVRRQGLALVLSVVGWGLAIAVSGMVSSLAFAVVLLALAGAADLISAVYRQTILQTYAPDELRGRLQGVFIVVVAGGPRLGDMRAGATAAVAGVTVSWVGGGVACVVLAIVLAVSAPAILRYRGPKEPVPDAP
jgi:Transmembrane secretion effector